ncbi:MAG: Obg family GTPase CgtA, partial [Lachnospiraceae bacterium]|nr:Obg family GTPase CgtA [Lachnospiraceae bacterium]
ILHIVDAASTEGRDPVADIYAINRELEAYNAQIAQRPQIIAANKIDMIYDTEDPVARIKAEFEPQGIPVYAISAISGQGLRDLLYDINNRLEQMDSRPVVFEQEFFPESHFDIGSEPFTVVYDEKEDAYVVEGPRIEKMLSYTNLESEKGFKFFQDFLKVNGILEQLGALGIEEGDTVRMYGLSFDYYK